MVALLLANGLHGGVYEGVSRIKSQLLALIRARDRRRVSSPGSVAACPPSIVFVMWSPAVIGAENQADLDCANPPPIRSSDKKLHATLTETVLNFARAYWEQANMMEDRLAARQLDCHYSGVNVYGFAVDAAGVIIPTLSSFEVGLCSWGGAECQIL
jgi:hypothetical protein